MGQLLPGLQRLEEVNDSVNRHLVDERKSLIVGDALLLKEHHGNGARGEKRLLAIGKAVDPCATPLRIERLVLVPHVKSQPIRVGRILEPHDHLVEPVGVCDLAHPRIDLHSLRAAQRASRLCNLLRRRIVRAAGVKSFKLALRLVEQGPAVGTAEEVNIARDDLLELD